MNKAYKANITFHFPDIFASFRPGAGAMNWTMEDPPDDWPCDLDGWAG